MSRKTLGLRGRLVLVQVGVFALLLGASGVVRYLWLQQTYLTEVDDQLRRTGLDLRQELRITLPQFGGDHRAAVEHIVSDLIFVDRAMLAVDSLGTQFAIGRTKGSVPSIRSIDPFISAAVPITTELRGSAVRVYRVPLPDGLAVIVATSMLPTARRLESFLGILLTTTALILVIAACVAWWASRAILQPVTSVAIAAQRLGDEIRDGASTFGRLPKAGGADEVATLTKDFNRLLAALETALSRERKTANRFRQFLADAAHELRTPIAIIRAEAESAQADPTPGASQAALTSIASEAARLGAIVGDLMMLARRDAGGRVPRSRVFLDDIAASAVARLGSHPVAEGRQLRLGEFDAAPVLGDRETLERAVVILVHNALVHAAPSPVEISTGVHLSSEGARSWARVRDWGPGIPIAQQDRIFDRFARLDHSRPGTGLGLAIARAIAEECDGTLTVESESGGGACFLLELPCADDLPEPEVTASVADSGIPVGA